MFSIARLQKYEFCPRAFYFRYFESDNHWSNDLINLVETKRLQEISEMHRYFLLANLTKDFFYNRLLSDSSQKRTIYRECRKFDLDNNEIESIKSSLTLFCNSPFYLETHPGIVNHLEIESMPQISIGEQEVTGSVHLAWVENSGRFNIVKISKKLDSDLSFLVLYALKKFQVALDKLNIGILDPSTWRCHWQAINWHAISEYQERALTFKIGNNWQDFPPTKYISRCQICNYSDICKDFSKELETL